MSRWIHLYLLEILVALASIATSIGLFILLRCVLKLKSAELTYVSIANAGCLFILGNIYSRLKERRDVKRKRAQELFLEWHSNDVRNSRIFVSRWIAVHGEEALPALSTIEYEAASAYRERYKQLTVAATAKTSETLNLGSHELDDPALKELHFFRVYQFFERWLLLVKNSDIDHLIACEYMSSYKNWYLEKFIKPWLKLEPADHIKQQLVDIVRVVDRARET
jgi:hypothetical protein